MSPVVRRLFFEPAVLLFQECVFRPAVDVLRAPYGWIIKAELPGVPPDQVELIVAGNSILMRGARKDTVLEDGEGYHILEISYSRFERTIELPTSLEGAQLGLSSDKGLLILRVILPSRHEPR